jgi:ethanolamine utilization microcompartment shell protein EutS
MAEHKEIVTDIMENHPGKEITRAWLIAAIEDALLVERGARADLKPR